MSATYSPEDNKLRLYASSRLDEQTYVKVREAGFKWAPKQELFVAPSWTPFREDFLLELCGEIGDEDTSLVERAEAKADRLEELSEKRANEANSAKSAVDAIADGVPLGQPILVGHHSEKRARKDAEKIQNGMRRAVQLWETSQYWKDRAAGALHAAKYKERPDVRARRIKKLESEQRKIAKDLRNLEALLKFWESNPTREKAISVCNCYDHGGVKLPDGENHWSAWSALTDEKITVEAVTAQRIDNLPKSIAHYKRWSAHYENRLTYERAMLDEQGGLVADGFDLKVGGRILAKGVWLTITKINKSGGRVSSVSTNNTRWPRVVSVETIKGYQPPTDEQAKAAKQSSKLPPIANYPGDGFAGITQEQWNGIHKDYKGTCIMEATDQHGRHRVRQAMSGLLRRAGAAVHGEGYVLHRIWITDAPRKDPPGADSAPPPEVKGPELDLRTLQEEAARRESFRAKDEEAPKGLDAMREALRAGVQVVAAPQLFPTPPELARRVIGLADIRPGQRVLEPSAGTGNLCKAVIDAFTGCDCGRIVAVEINHALADNLRTIRNATLYANEDNYDIRCADFLECDGELGDFDRIVMNPPFERGADIKHIEHALTHPRPRGRLVAICANGPRQRERLMKEATEWIDLPAGSFKASGTEVNAAIVVIDR